MKIQDAKPGDVLRDKNGAMWLRGIVMARCVHDPVTDMDGDGVGSVMMTATPFDALSVSTCEQFGPFTRLVPEVEQ